MELLILVIVVVPAAYWLRFSAPLSSRLRDMTGGAAYVLFWSAGALAIMPRRGVFRITGVVLLATCCLECLQLWHPPWLEAMRRTLAGRLVLGTTFDWADFLSYFIGAALSCLVLRLLTRNFGIKPAPPAIQHR